MTVSFRANDQVRAKETVTYFLDPRRIAPYLHDGTAEPCQVTPPEAVAYHWSYTWLFHNDANTVTATDPSADNWSQVAQWHVDLTDISGPSIPITGLIDFAHNPKANAFQGWLSAVGALNAGTPPSASVLVVRHDTDIISPVAGRTQQWLYRDGAHCSVATQTACTSNANCAPLVCQGLPQTTCTVSSDCPNGSGPCLSNTCPGTYAGQQTPLHFTFNTPVNLVEDLSQTPPLVQCGRVLFSDFHVNDANETPTPVLPESVRLNVSRAVTGKLVCQGKAPTACTVASQATDCPNGTGPCVTDGTCTTDAQCTGTCSAGKCPWGSACTSNAQCASTCSNGICIDPMTAQEKLLEYMLFDLGSCVPPREDLHAQKDLPC